MSEMAVTTQSLGKRFGRQWAIRALDLKVPQGCVYGLLGRNGAGKSTTMDLLTSLLKPTEGGAFILGHSLATERSLIASEISYVDQAKTLYDYLTVGQMMELARGLATRWSETLAAKHIKLPGASRIRSLSKGQRVQLAFGLAAARRARLLLVDEPTANLDPVAVQRVLRGLIEDCVAEGTTVLIASHDLEEVAQVCDRVGLLERGRLRHEVSLEDMETNYRVITVLHENPGMAGTPDIISVRRIDGTARYLVRGSVPDISAGLTAKGAKILDVQPATLRTLYLELLDDTGAPVDRAAGAV
jgi:ABC-2 type transport system ATP-binding protein